MNTPPPATPAHTGTCTHLTLATLATPTAPTGTNHRTGCCDTKLSKVTTRGTAGSAAAPGPETPTELRAPPPDQPPLHVHHSFLTTQSSPVRKQKSSFRSILLPVYLNLGGIKNPPPPHPNQMESNRATHHCSETAPGYQQFLNFSCFAERFSVVGCLMHWP